MKNQFLVFLLFIGLSSLAQKGTVTGTVSDKDLNNEPLPFSNVLIKGTNIGVTTDENGKFSLSVEPGNYILNFSFLGYESQEQNITVIAGQETTANASLGAGSYTLKDVVIQTQQNREKESALLLDQKNAVEIKQNIGAQELSRKGVTDVATAVTKTSGVTKQEGSGNIYVRGLGDRYNSTTLNGLPIPSNNAENKNITLEIFPTDIVEYVSIDKVYSGRFYGDFAGGNVDILSKDYKGKGFFKVEIGSNINTNAVSDDNFRLSEGPGAFGFSNSGIPSNALTQYNYESLSLDRKNPFAGSIGISGGDSYNVGSEGKLSFFATAAFGNEYLSVTDGKAYSNISGAGLANQRFDDYKSYSYGTNTTAMVNVNYKANASHKLSYNSLFINTSSQETEEYKGYAADFAEDGNGFIRRSTYSKTSLFVNQLLGAHKFGERIGLNWGISFNTVADAMPDRTQNKMNQVASGYLINSQSAPNNHRYFQELDENELAANILADYKFAKTADGDYKGKLTFGYNGRIKNRDFEAAQFNFKTVTDPISHAGDIVDPENLDAFYNQENYSNNFFTISTFRGVAEVPGADRPQTYTGDLTIHAGLLSAEYKFNPRFTGVLGLRAEKITQDVVWDTQIGGTGEDNLDKTAFLPNLMLKYELSEKQNLRLGFSKTYTLPQFKERAAFVYEEVTQVKVGNPDLYESDNYNFDLKWEIFPKSDELISVTAFGKYIQNPINEVVIASSTNDISYVNTGDTGYVLGAEAEYRKLLYGSDDELDSGNKLSAGINVSYLYTDQELDSEKIESETDYSVDFTNSEGQFTGASDLLINADLSYFMQWNQKNSNLTATIAYNYFSDRVYALGTSERGDLVDKAVGTLDFIVKSKLGKNIGFGLSVKNILNPQIERVQENNSGDVQAQTYKKGMNLSLGVNYQF